MMRRVFFIFLLLLSITVGSSAQVSSTIQRDNTILPADHGEGALGSFGFRYLTDKYRGPVARIRRGIDSAELDFIPEHLQGDSLKNWVGQNLVTNSQEFQSPIWGSSVNTLRVVHVDSIIAPDGSQTAELVYAGTNNANMRKQPIEGMKPGVPYTFSVYAKTLSQGNVEFLMDIGDGYKIPGTGGPFTLSQNWERYSVSSLKYKNGPFLDITMSNKDSLYCFWGAMLEEGIDTTSYIKTDNSGCCDGFVTKLYNQSELTLDLAMDTLHRQPKVYENGVRAEVGSALAMKFDGQNDMLILPWLSSALAEAYWAATHEGRGAEDYSIFISGGGTAQIKDAAAIYSPVDTAEAFKWSIYPSGWITADTFPLTGRPYVYRIHQTESDSRMYLNQELVFEHPKGAIPTIIARVGCRFAYPADRFFKGTIGELILYPKVRFDYSPASIQTNIARHFKIE